MLNFVGVPGTCIARHATLQNPNYFKTTKKELATLLRGGGGGLVFMETTEAQKEFRDVLIELGASSNRVGNNYVHAIDTSAIVNEEQAELQRLIAEGEALSRAEGRNAGEIRTGDRVLYVSTASNGPVTPQWLAVALSHRAGGQDCVVNKADKTYVYSWTSPYGGTYSSSYWYHGSFRRIP